MEANSSQHCRRPIIAIDGPAASGKSTTARLVADKLNFTYIDTGAMYRAMTLKLLRIFGAGASPENVTTILPQTRIELHNQAGRLAVYLDGEDVTLQIRLPEVSAEVSRISAMPAVREKLVALQRVLGEQGGVVLDGRDIGTYVFPNAQIKVFLEASLTERAKRRLHDMQRQTVATSLEDQLEKLKQRDAFDSQREHSPLIRAEDAVVIDTSVLTIDDQVREVLNLVRQKLN